jgi:polysaccharide export outer membrane protein
MRHVIVILCLVMSVMLEGCAVPRHIPFFDVDPNAPYTLGSGDRLRIIVFGQESLSNSYAVDSSGHIAMPLIGIVDAQGQTTASLARRIEAQLRNGFLREPRVSVEVEAFRPFFILGEVTTPGQYPFVSGMTIETAVAIAGGFTPRAFKDGADLSRVVDGQPFIGTVPDTQLVRPGDTIFVHERFF